MVAEEFNFDGIIGPTHHYGGHAYGNLASMQHQKQISHPKKAALQGLKKMKFLMDLGIPQAVLPPLLRPSLSVLRALGFRGSDREIFCSAAEKAPQLLLTLSSSSSMWTANCATFTPSTDTLDNRAHMTVANLQSNFHRSIESDETFRLLRLIFPDEKLFHIHPALPKGGDFGDEGAANHTRFCRAYGEKGFHLFVYGKSAFESSTKKFPMRQAKEASEAVARLHGLSSDRTFFIRQNLEVIQKGVFHNDVISVGNRNLFLYHEKAFSDDLFLNEIQKICPLQLICVTENMLSVERAVETYLFNSQIVTLPNGEDALIAPQESSTLNLDWLPIKYFFIDVRESMQNGGGPACLRFRCVLNEAEKSGVHASVILTPERYLQLSLWVEKYYRENLTIQELQDPQLLREVFEALDALTKILDLGAFYDFQREADF
jgi:succinylarginine dihydrolase